MAPTHEKDLSTSQSQTGANPRLSGADGDSGWPQRPAAAAGKGPHTAGNFDTSETARIAARFREYQFAATNRLHRRAEFLGAQRTGLRWQTQHFVIYASMASNPATRLGVTVSRKVGNAVERSALKRRIRECFRLKLRDIVPLGTDLVIIARSHTGASKLATAVLCDELCRGVAHLNRRSNSP